LAQKHMWDIISFQNVYNYSFNIIYFIFIIQFAYSAKYCTNKYSILINKKEEKTIIYKVFFVIKLSINYRIFFLCVNTAF